MAKKTGKDITFGLRLDDKPFQKGMDDASKGVTKLQGKVRSGFARIGKNLKASFAGWGKNLASTLVNPVTAVFAGAAIGAGILKGFRSALDAGFQDLQIDKKLSAQLSKIGKETEFEGLKDFAGKFENAFSIDDTDIKTQMTKLLEAGVDPKQLRAYTALIADVHKSTGKDLETVTDAISKAAMGRVRGLSQFGVSITPSGNLAQDIDNAFKLLQSLHGGMAANQANENPFARYQQAMGNFLEDLGKKFMPTVTRVLDFMTAGISSITESTMVADFFNMIDGFMDNLDKVIVANFGNYEGIFISIYNWVATKWNQIVPNVNLVISYIRAAIIGLLDGRILTVLMEQVNNTFSLVFEIGISVFESFIPAILAVVRDLFNKIQREALPFFSWLVLGPEDIGRSEDIRQQRNLAVERAASAAESIYDNHRERLSLSIGKMTGGKYTQPTEYIGQMPLKDMPSAFGPTPQQQDQADIYAATVDSWASPRVRAQQAAADDKVARKEAEKRRKENEKSAKMMEKQRQQNEEKRARERQQAPTINIGLQQAGRSRGVQMGYRI